MQFSGVLTFIYEERDFGDFLTIFACKIFNIDVESTKVVLKIQAMDRITKKYWKIIFFWKFWSKLGKLVKNCNFLQKCIQNYILHYNLGLNDTRDMKFCECMQKKLQKTQGKRNFELLIFFQFYWILFVFLTKKSLMVYR